MKYLPLMVLVGCLSTAGLSAQTSTSLNQVLAIASPTPSPEASPARPGSGNLEPQERWVEQIDGGFALPADPSPAHPDSGIGGDINIGYRFNRTLALFIGSGYYQFAIPSPAAGSEALLAYIPLAAILRVTFGDGPIRPYFFGGAGIALNTFTQNYAPGSAVLKISHAETDFYLAPGLGFLYRFSGNMAVFLQTRVDLDYTSAAGLGLPLDGPSVFIPIQAGLSFFAL